MCRHFLCPPGSQGVLEGLGEEVDEKDGGRRTKMNLWRWRDEEEKEEASGCNQEEEE